MNIRPFTLLANSVLLQLHSAAKEVLATWGKNWAIAQDGVQCECQRVWEEAVATKSSSGHKVERAPVWRQSYRTAPQTQGAVTLPGEQVYGQIWFAYPAELLGQLQMQLFGPERDYARPGVGEASIAPQLAEQALQELLTALAEKFLPGGSKMPVLIAPSDDVFAYASGAARINVRIGKYTCQLVCDAAAVRQFSKVEKISLPALGKVSYKKLLSDAKVVLPISIGSAQVSLGSLRALSVGDVVRLDRSVEKPLVVRGQSGEIWFDAYLGKMEKNIALEIVRHEK